MTAKALSDIRRKQRVLYYAKEIDNVSKDELNRLPKNERKSPLKQSKRYEN